MMYVYTYISPVDVMILLSWVLHEPLHVHVITNNEKNLAGPLPRCFPAHSALLVSPFFAISSSNAIAHASFFILNATCDNKERSV
jgi:hypothetical protein